MIYGPPKVRWRVIKSVSKQISCFDFEKPNNPQKHFIINLCYNKVAKRN